MALWAQTLPSWPMMAAAERWLPSISHIRWSSTYVCHDIFVVVADFEVFLFLGFCVLWDFVLMFTWRPSFININKIKTCTLMYVIFG